MRSVAVYELCSKKLGSELTAGTRTITPFPLYPGISDSILILGLFFSTDTAITNTDGG
mgnify:FL=1